MTAYMYFNQEERKKVKEQSPKANFSEIGRQIGERWRRMSDEDKQKYVELHKTDRERYDREVSELPAGAKSGKKKKQDNGQPKRAKSSFMIFSQEQRPLISKENPGATFSELGKLVGTKWKSLSEDDKDKYVKLGQEEKERYKKDVADFEASGGVIEKIKRKKKKKAGSEDDDDEEEKPKKRRRVSKKKAKESDNEEEAEAEPEPEAEAEAQKESENEE